MGNFREVFLALRPSLERERDEKVDANEVKFVLALKVRRKQQFPYE